MSISYQRGRRLHCCDRCDWTEPAGYKMLPDGWVKCNYGPDRDQSLDEDPWDLCPRCHEQLIEWFWADE